MVCAHPTGQEELGWIRIGEGGLQGGLQLAEPPPPPAPHSLPACRLHQSLHLYPDCGGVCGLMRAAAGTGCNVMLFARRDWCSGKSLFTGSENAQCIQRNGYNICFKNIFTG